MNMSVRQRVAIRFPILHSGKTFEEVTDRSEEHTSELQSRSDLVCRLLLEKKKKEHRLEGPRGSDEPDDLARVQGAIEHVRCMQHRVTRGEHDHAEDRRADAIYKSLPSAH